MNKEKIKEILEKVKQTDGRYRFITKNMVITILEALLED